MKIAVASLVSQPRKNAWPAPGKIPMISATGAKPSSTSATTWARITASERKPSSATAPSAPTSDEHRERQALEGAAGLLGVDGGRVGLVDPVARELPIERRRLALAERVVFGLALLRARALAQEARGVAAVAVLARLEVVAADVARRVVRADGAREAVVVEAVGVDAVREPAELEHRPRLHDERLEEVVGDLALGLLGIVERAAVGAGEERERERVGPLRGLADRCARAGRRRTARSRTNTTRDARARRRSRCSGAARAPSRCPRCRRSGSRRPSRTRR